MWHISYLAVSAGQKDSEIKLEDRSQWEIESKRRKEIDSIVSWKETSKWDGNTTSPTMEHLI